MSLGKEIRKARIDVGLSQKALAETLQLSQQYVSFIEHDQVDIRISTFYKIAAAVQASPNQLLEYDAWVEQKEQRAIAKLLMVAPPQPAYGLLADE